MTSLPTTSGSLLQWLSIVSCPTEARCGNAFFAKQVIGHSVIGLWSKKSEAVDEDVTRTAVTTQCTQPIMIVCAYEGINDAQEHDAILIAVSTVSCPIFGQLHALQASTSEDAASSPMEDTIRCMGNNCRLERCRPLTSKLILHVYTAEAHTAFAGACQRTNNTG